MYEERVPVPAWWWLAGVFIVVSLAVAVWPYVGMWTAVILIAGASIAIVVGLLGYGLRIHVDEGVLQVGRHVLEGEYIADAVVLDDMSTGQADHDSFLLTRPFVQPLVRVVIADHADPHPAWLVSTRRPDEFAEAVRAIRKV